jgi:uncharacterized repeat protein (TIGR01451 family)
VTFASSLADDPLVNTATATDLASGATASGSDSDARNAQSALAIVKTDNSSTYTPGGTGTYTVVVTNAGPSAALAVTVSDALPAGVTLAATPQCVPAGTADCGTVSGSAGQASFGATGASIDAGGGNALTFTAPVAYAAAMTTNPLVNTVTASDGAHPPVSASDSDALAASVVLAVTKTDGTSTYLPGGNGIYVIVVTNTGISDAASVSVDDILPAGVTLAGAVTCSVAGNASCGAIAGGPDFTVSGARIGAGAGNALTYTVPVSFAASLTAATITNVVTVADAPTGASATASDTDSLAPSGTTLAKTIVPPTIGIGGSATLTLTLGNTGAGPLTLIAAFVDAMPAGVTTTSGNTGTCAGVTVAAASVTMATGATIPVGGCTIVVAITSSTTGTVTNTTGTLSTSGGSAPPASAQITVTSGAGIASLAKTIVPAQIPIGGSATLTITLGNSGTVPLTLTASFTDPMPFGMSVVSPHTGTCVGVSATSTLITLPAGSSIPPGGCTIVVTVTSSTLGTAANVTSALEAGGTTAPAASAPLVVVAANLPPVEDISTLSPAGLALLLVALGAMGGLCLRRRS